MTERTFTKGEIMSALNALKEPSDVEKCRGSISGTEPIKFAIAGAETLVEALEGCESPRLSLIEKVGKICLMSIVENESPRLAGIFSGLFGISEEAERITTPPEESDA